MRTRFRWIVVALAFVITLVNYIDRSAISYAVGPIKQEFGLDNTAFGVITGAFGFGYVVVAVASGILVDRIGARTMWSGAAIAWSIVTGVFSLANGFWQLLWCRTALGAAEGPNFPSLTRVCADWLPIHERGRATAWSLAAVPIACVIAAPLVSHLIINLGWRVMFLVLATAGLLWSVFWIALFRNDPATSAYVSKSELSHIVEENNQYQSSGNSKDEIGKQSGNGQESALQRNTTWKFLLFNPSLVTNNIAFSAFGYLLFFSVYWLPAYLEEAYGIHLKDVGWYLTIPWATAAVFVLVGGWISDTVWIRTHSIRKSRSYLVAICQLLAALSFVPIIFWHSLPIALISMSLGVGFGLMPNSAFYNINSDLAQDRAGTSLGIMNFCAAVSSISAPVITGALSSIGGNYNAAFFLIILYLTISVLAVFLFQRPDRYLHSSRHTLQLEGQVL